MDEVQDFQVTRAKILPPLGDAVGLIHRQKVDGESFRQAQEALCLQPLRGNVDDFIASCPDVGEHRTHLLGGETAVDVGCQDARFLQRGHLILHQGDQRADHEGQTGQEQRRDLIAKAFPAAGGHDAEDVLPGQDRVDEYSLSVQEGFVAEIFSQYSLLIHCFSPSTRNYCVLFSLSSSPSRKTLLICFRVAFSSI